LLDQGARQEHPLPLAAGELGVRRVAQVGETDAGQCLARAVAVGSGQPAQERRAGVGAHQRHVVRRDGEARMRRAALRHRRERPVQGDAACRPRQQPEQRAEERRLAGAVRPHEGHELARADDERDVLDHRSAAPLHAQPVDDEHGATRRHPVSPFTMMSALRRIMLR
jgi:hypothetical protein